MAVKITIKDGKVYTIDGRKLVVLEVENGVVTLLPWFDSTIQSWAEFIEECFDTESNFIDEIMDAFGDGAAFIGIKFEFEGINVFVDSVSASKYEIFSKWNTTWNENDAKRLLSKMTGFPEESKNVINVDLSTELQFKNVEAKKAWEQVEFNAQNGSKILSITYARRWAKYMQHLMSETHKSVYEVVDDSAELCDIEGITGAQKAVAISLLINHWKYGEEICKWHNNVR